MPSSVGHALAGVAAAWGADLVPGNRAWRTAPKTSSWYRRAGDGLTLACAGLAVLPDVDLIFHFHRTLTHSFGATVLVALVAAAIARRLRRPALRVALMCAGAYGTHIVLDWLSADSLPPYGIEALWPFSTKWFISGWDVFRQTERRHFLSIDALRTNAAAIAQELAILVPIVGLVWLVRVKALAGLAAKLSGRDHAAQ